MKYTKESLIKLAEGLTVFRTEAALQTLKDALEFALDEVFAEHDRLTKKAYLLGFMASSEGYNSEYPFGDKGQDPEQDVEWCKGRDYDFNARLK